MKFCPCSLCSETLLFYLLLSLSDLFHLYHNIIYHIVNGNNFASFWISSAKYDKEQKLNFQLLISRMLKFSGVWI